VALLGLFACLPLLTLGERGDPAGAGKFMRRRASARDCAG